MIDPFVWWCVIVGVLLILATLGGSFIARLPLSAAMLYLVVGYGMGPQGMGLIQLDPLRDAAFIERMTEVAVLISLFSAGFKLELPLNNRGWRVPVQLATLSMLLTVGCITAVGVYLLHVPLGAAIVLGAILAPTDPVLASDVQIADPGDSDPLRFGLTGEGGLNDGTAFPLLMLGLGLLSLHELGSGGWRWWAVDVGWAIAGGLGIGYLLGHLTGRTVLYLRARHQEASGADEFIAFGLIALAYGLALLCHTYGFLAVFAAGLALNRAKKSLPASLSPVQPADSIKSKGKQTSDPAENSPAMMMNAVQSFNSQLERFTEVAVVLVLGALISQIEFQWRVLWFVPLLFLVIRPLAVSIGLMTTGISRRRRALMAWFGIRGIGSLYYLAYAIGHGVDEELAHDLMSITVSVVVTSIVVHGISVTPLMNWYEKRRHSRRR